jgi:Tfp pilus assembly protein PilE
MRGLIGILIVAVIGVVVYRLYLSQVQRPEGGGTTPVQTISATGAQNDLLAIAQAERVYYTEHGSYASLDDLVSSGSLSMGKPARAGFTYSVETTAGGFTAAAKCDSSPAAPCTNFAVDETMQVHAAP